MQTITGFVYIRHPKDNRIKNYLRLRNLWIKKIPMELFSTADYLFMLLLCLSFFIIIIITYVNLRHWYSIRLNIFSILSLNLKIGEKLRWPRWSELFIGSRRRLAPPTYWIDSLGHWRYRQTGIEYVSVDWFIDSQPIRGQILALPGDRYWACIGWLVHR